VFFPSDAKPSHPLEKVGQPFPELQGLLRFSWPWRTALGQDEPMRARTQDQLQSLSCKDPLPLSSSPSRAEACAHVLLIALRTSFFSTLHRPEPPEVHRGNQRTH